MKWYRDKKYLMGSILVPAVLAFAGWIYENSSPSKSIVNVPNNTGIVTQGQTGNKAYALEGLSPLVRHYQILCYVMLGLMPGIHASNIAAGSRFGHVDGRDKPGHDGHIWIPPEATE